MNYSTLYELRPKIERIYSKIEELGNYGFDTKSYLEEIKMFSIKLDQIKEENNSMIGNVAYQAEDDKLIKDLSALINDFESFIDKLLLSSKLLFNHKDISKKLNLELTDDEFNKIISQILNNLLDINELKKYGFKLDSNSKELFKTIYIAIKKEYQLKGSSSIHNTLINMHLNESLYDYMAADISVTRDKLDKMITSNQVEIELMFTISLDENNYKEKIYAEKRTLEKSKINSKESQSMYESKITLNNDEISELKQQNRMGRSEYLAKIISFLLSISLLAGGVTFAINKGKPKIKTYFRTEKACYDTIDGSYNSSTYSESLDNPKVLKVYGEVNEKGERTIKIYSLEGESENPEDYIDYSVSDDDLIDTQNVSKSDIINNKSTSEYSVIEITTNVDEEDFIEQAGSKWLILLYSLLVVVLYTVIEAALYYLSDEELGSYAFFFEEGLVDSIDDIGEIINNKREIRKLIQERTRNSKDAKQFKEQFEAYERMDKELEEKYKLLFQKSKKLELK